MADILRMYSGAVEVTALYHGDVTLWRRGARGPEPLQPPSISGPLPFMPTSTAHRTLAEWPDGMTIVAMGWHRRVGLTAWSTLDASGPDFTAPLNWNGGDQLAWIEDAVDEAGRPSRAISNILTLVALPALAPSTAPTISATLPVTVGSVASRLMGTWPDFATVVRGWYHSVDAGVTWEDIENTDDNLVVPPGWDVDDKFAWIEDGGDDYGRTLRVISNVLTVSASGALQPEALPVISGPTPLLAGSLVTLVSAGRWPEGTTVTEGWYRLAAGSETWVYLGSGSSFAAPTGWSVGDQLARRERGERAGQVGIGSSNILVMGDIAIPIPDGQWTAQEAAPDTETRRTTLIATIPQLIDKTVLVYRGDVDPGADQLALALGTVAWDATDGRYEWLSNGLAARGSTVYVRLARQNPDGSGRQWISNTKTFVASNTPAAPVFSGEINGSGQLVVTFGTPDGRGRAVTAGKYRINTGSWVNFSPAASITIASPPTEDFNLSVIWVNVNGDSTATTHVISVEPVTDDWDIEVNEPDRLVMAAIPPQPNKSVVSNVTRTGFDVSEGVGVGSLWNGMVMVPSADFNPASPTGYYPRGLIVEGNALPLISSGHIDDTEYSVMNFGAKTPVNLVPSLIFEDRFPGSNSGPLLGKTATGGTWATSNLATSLFSVSSGGGAYAGAAEMLTSSATLAGTGSYYAEYRARLQTTNSASSRLVLYDADDSGARLVIGRSSSTVLAVILSLAGGSTITLAEATIAQNVSGSSMVIRVEYDADTELMDVSFSFTHGSTGVVTTAETLNIDMSNAAYEGYVAGRIAIYSGGNMGNNGGGSRISRVSVGAL